MAVHFQKRQERRQFVKSNVQHSDRIVPATAMLSDFADPNSGLVLMAKRINDERTLRHRQVYEVISGTFKFRSSIIDKAYQRAHDLAEIGGERFHEVIQDLKYGSLREVLK